MGEHSLAAFLLADGRFPAGGHAHSGGVESAVDLGLIISTTDLERFLRGRLWTVGLTAAALAAAAWAIAFPCAVISPDNISHKERPDSKPSHRHPSHVDILDGDLSVNDRSWSGNHARYEDWMMLDAEADARIPSPALRRSSRLQGSQLLRTSLAVWPSPMLQDLADMFGYGSSHGPHHPMALGACAAAAHLDAEDAALLAAYGSVVGPGYASLKLLGFDPATVTAILAGLVPEVGEIAVAGVNAAALGNFTRLPGEAAPVLDLLAQYHASKRGCLFAS
ncbi:MAG: urease accessory protein UreF [Acidimicrobiales bacterium]